MSKDVLLQTRVPAPVAREVKRRAAVGGDSDAGWLRRLLIATTATKPPGEFLNLGHLFIRKANIAAMIWVDPHAGSCAAGEKPWELCVQYIDGSTQRLSTAHAKVVLEAFGLPTENPHPKGSKSE